MLGKQKQHNKMRRKWLQTGDRILKQLVKEQLVCWCGLTWGCHCAAIMRKSAYKPLTWETTHFWYRNPTVWVGFYPPCVTGVWRKLHKRGQIVLATVSCQSASPATCPLSSPSLQPPFCCCCTNSYLLMQSDVAYGYSAKTLPSLPSNSFAAMNSMYTSPFTLGGQ